MRFPEFRGEWKYIELQELAPNISSGKDKPTNGSIALYGSTGQMGMTDKVSYTNEIVIVARVGANAGTMQIVNEPCGVTDNALVVNAGLWNKYIFYYLQKCNLNRLIFGSGQPLITGGMLKKIKIKYGCEAERSKIVKTLTLLDERISTQSRIIEDLKSERKFLLEQLFCLPKEHSPKLRLKGMTGDWNKVRLYDIVERITERNKANTCSRVLTIAAQYGLIDQQEFFNKQIASSDLTTYYLLHKGDFAYNKSYSGDYPWGAVKRLDNYNEGVLSSLYVCFRPNGNVDSDFLCHYFESTKWYRGISEISGEGARNHGLLNMSVDDYFNTIHRIPSLEEQRQISTMLNTIVQKIKIEESIIDKLQKQKSYLLKEMFV